MINISRFIFFYARGNSDANFNFSRNYLYFNHFISRFIKIYFLGMYISIFNYDSRKEKRTLRKSFAREKLKRFCNLYVIFLIESHLNSTLMTKSKRCGLLASSSKSPLVFSTLLDLAYLNLFS